MRHRMLVQLEVIAMVAAGLSGPAPALEPTFMTQSEIRTDLVGHAMKGYYRPVQGDDRSGERWIDDYAADGGIKYSDSRVVWTGRWSFQNDVFCTYYNDGVDGGCYLVRAVSRNCYEYVIVPNDWSQRSVPAGASAEWFARGWRSSETSTCEDPLLS
jgi:hypothetical protein